MMKRFFQFKSIFILLLSVGALYGVSRLYYAITDGFTVGNITSDLTHDPRWVTRSSPKEQEEFQSALNQEYAYLGKGCQAYVFESADGNYVLKFFKYQRFRPQWWLNAFAFIPAVESHRQFKAKEKKDRLDNVFKSWKIAYEDLPRETGVIYVHLNKSNDLQRVLTVSDKMGIRHKLDLDQMEFLLQRKADMLCPTLKSMIANRETLKAQLLIDDLLVMLLLEYSRGYADNDHALMQNTGVWNGKPVHIDVGQLIYNSSVKYSEVHRKELYDKTYKFHLWLKENDNQLADYLQNRLIAIIGEEYFLKGPYIHKSDVAKIPHQEHYPNIQE